MDKGEIVLAGGCFWGTEAYLKRLPGIIQTEAGYANSSTPQPSYEEVCSGETGAAEAVRVIYDKDVIPLPLLLEAYLRTIDPTSLNRQGNDRGTQYRTGIYWTDERDEPIVVSEINERLSPNIEPPITEPIQSAISNPDALDTDTAIGVINVIVPTDVPMATDTKQATTNNTATENLAGISDNMKYATLSALLLPTTPTKEPAARKIRSMVIIFLSPTPCAMISSFLSKFTALFCKQATRTAVRNATTIGTL